MSKKNIRYATGKQLYLNQIFYKGMLYNSSEMQEGYAKVIDNYDIASTGDAASPRLPLNINGDNVFANKWDRYVFPVSFKQNQGKQSYVVFNETISESDFANDVVSSNKEAYKTVEVYSRNDNAFSTSKDTPIVSDAQYYAETTSTTDTEEETTNPTIQAYKDAINSDDVINIQSEAIADNNSTQSVSVNTVTIINAVAHHLKDEYTPEDDLKIIYGGIISDYKPELVYKFKQYYNEDNTIKNADIYNFKSYYYTKETPVSTAVTLEDTIIKTEYHSFDEQSVVKLTEENGDTFANSYLMSDVDIRVIDGDTIAVTINDVTTKYRLYAVDTTEISTKDKWSIYAKEVLQNIINSFNGEKDLISIKSMNQQSYDRTVARIELLKYTDYQVRIAYYNHTDDSGKQHRSHVQLCKYNALDLGILMLSTGLGTIRYAEHYDTINDPLGYVKAQEFAARKKYKRFSLETDDDYDPYSSTTTSSTISYTNNPLVIKDNQYIQAVRLEDEYYISGKTKNIVNFVDAKYIDYMDAIVFMGRIMEPQEVTITESETPDWVDQPIDKIIYKGPIILQANTVTTAAGSSLSFNIVLPANQGEGDTPNIIDATTNGYNLLNKDMLSIANGTSSSTTFGIIGLAPLDMDYDVATNSYTLPTPTRVVTSTLTGKRILLKAIINENGSYYYSDLTTTTVFGYRLVIPEIPLSYTNNVTSTTYSITLPSAIISKLPGASTFMLSHIYNIEALVAENTDIDEDDKNAFIVTFKNVLKTKLNSTTGVSAKLYLVEPVTNKEIFVKDVTIKSTFTQHIPNAMLELATAYDEDDASINVYSNFASINYKVTQATSGDISLTARTSNSIKLDFFRQWYIAEQGSDTFTPIGDELKIYTKSDTTSLSKVDTDAWEEDIKPTDYEYIVNRTGNLTFKFSIKPKIPMAISEGCPDTINGMYLENEFQEMYAVIPKVTIGTEYNVITDASLRKNIDIKNATRVDIFNRQLCLYGPYTISNALFFSKFENNDYIYFPYGTIEVDEPITYVYNYKDAFIIFGKYNIYMLSGAANVNECTLYRIYENLTTHLADVRAITTVGNNLIFYNNGMGYVIVPNTYVDNSSNIKVYKLTEYISNFFYNPEAYVRTRIPDIDILSNLSFAMSFISYAQNNEVILVNNIKVNETKQDNTNNTHYLMTWFIYDQNYKYWRMYSTTIFDEVIDVYICEPNLNNQFVVIKNDRLNLAFFKNSFADACVDTDGVGNDIPITTMLSSGYLSVDTMNDKRFKDLIFELDNINYEHSLLVRCEFYVDGAPMLLSNDDILVIDKESDTVISDKVLETYKDYDVHYIGDEDTSTNGVETTSMSYGTAFKIGNETYTSTGRTHVRIPVWGKGRLPAFILRIQSKGKYEFINYSLIYKEKSINRRS